MASLARYVDELLARGRACFSKDEAVAALGLSPDAFTAVVGRLARKHRVASPRRGFYLIHWPDSRQVEQDLIICRSLRVTGPV